MTLLNYIHHVSQTHLAGHLSPKSSRPTTPMPSEPVTPVDAVPPTLPAPAPTPSESLADAFVDAPTDPIEPTEIATAVVTEPEPTPAPVAETIEEEQPVAAEPVALGAPVEIKAEEHAESAAPVVQPEVAAATEVKPLVDDAHKQPTATHAEMGTLHTATEPATTVDGTPADKPTEETPTVAFAEPTAEAKEEKKDEKKVATKEKVEKTKAEGKGFFAKFFGSKDKSPKKERKVKTPKSEQADPTPVADGPASPQGTTDEPAAETSSSVPATEVRTIEPAESKPEITGVGLAAEPVAQVPVHVPEEAPVASNSAVVAEPEGVKESETTVPATAESAVEPKAETKPELSAAEKEVKAQKAHRRISTRITSFVKNIGGKKEHHGKDEHGKDVETSAETASTPVVSDEAPKIAEPTPAEPIQIDEKKPSTTHAAPPVAPAVAITA